MEGSEFYKRSNEAHEGRMEKEDHRDDQEKKHSPQGSQRAANTGLVVGR